MLDEMMDVPDKCPPPFLHLKSCLFVLIFFLPFLFLSLNIKVQLQEAERRWEEVQSYIRKRTAEHEAAQQGKGRGYRERLLVFSRAK